MSEPLLEVKGLRVEFPTRRGTLVAVDRVSFAIEPEYRRFVAVAGCAQKAAGPARVLVDGVALWERRLLLALDPAEQIDVVQRQHPGPQGGSGGGHGGELAGATHLHPG